ncbi:MULTISPECIES: methyltransferase family protein [Arsenicicoccus]|uniref:methyltransferase family protein n=1 Tax=Arsenicicoccus TaxID=267408 RepID=UPI00257B2C40|nr:MULTISPECIES: isoprenylcysteine carboxylmethyltransferase family protein [Arsenicicoccus]
MVAAAGVVCTYAAQLAMGTAWRIGVDPTERNLVTSGPFAFVRNPIFTAALITFTGLSFTTPNLVALTGLVVVYAGIQMQVRGVEEPHLLATHGQTYANYAARVGRFLPTIGACARPAARNSPSPLRHHPYRKALPWTWQSPPCKPSDCSS